MEKKIVWTNDFYWSDDYRSEVHDEVDTALAEGKAVMVSSTCMGHTRAAMVEADARRYFKNVGAVEVEKTCWGTYYALV